MKHKKLTALILCITMMFSITSGTFSAAFAEDSTTGSAIEANNTVQEQTATLFSTETETTTSSTLDYSSDIGKVAEFNEAYSGYFDVLENEPTASWETDVMTFAISDFSEDIQFKIIACTVWSDTYDITDETTDEVTGQRTVQSLWYQVNITNGTAADFADGYWIMQNYLNEEDAYEEDVLILSDAEEDEDDEDDTANACVICGTLNCTTEHLYCDTCGKFDCRQTHPQADPIRPATIPVIPDRDKITLTEGADVSIVGEYGDAVTEDGLLLAQGMRSSISAWIDLEDTEDMSYQWQICYDTDNDLWTNIQNQTGKGILISPAMVQSIIEETGEVLIRCQVTSGESIQYSTAIPVTIENISPAIAQLSLARTANNAITYAESDTYSVVINYVFENNETVAAAYTATLAAGSNFTASVNHPTVIGYLPYVGNETVASEKIELNITDIQEDMTYTVTYKPTNVNYTVIHYQQNIDNDNYTECERETMQGLTKSTVPDVAKTYDGFYALLYERPAIAADGSTIVEVYYDRNYYLVNFDMDGGYGTEPIYARYGASVVAETPIKVGYTFQGWSLDGTNAVSLPSTVPAENVTYKALWDGNDTAKVKVVFWGENPNDEEYSYLTTGVVDATPNQEYTYSNGTVFLICGKEEHTHTDCTLTCGKIEHTTHTDDCLDCDHVCGLSCYSASYFSLETTTKPDLIETPTHNGIYTYTTTSFFGTSTHYYLYLNGEWYCASGSWPIGGDTTEITSVCEHTHTVDCYKCEYHEHTAACYSCGLTEHTHDSTCNQTGSGLDSSLWTLVRSETVIVEQDGSSILNVYYDRTSFTMTFKEEGDGGDTLATITDKWGANINERFETISKENTFFWSTSQYGGSPWTSFMDVMPQENRTYYADPQSGSTTITATYLVENLDGTDGTDYETLYTVSFKGSSGITVSKEEFVDIEGFIFNEELSTDIGDSYNGAKFYYDRHAYAIEFYNPLTLLKKTENVPYQAPLSSYIWTPDASMAPPQYEPGAVEFEGWYLNPECTGEKFDFDTHTMPAGTKDGETTLMLYANWVSASHTVSFYLDKDAYDAGTKLSTHPDVTVSHGEKVEPVPATPVNGEYKFICWFYMDDGVEKAFDFANMSITKNMKIYGKWSSDVLKQYFVYFKIQDTDTEIADPITGSGLAGTTKTFDAKGGTDLYAEYQEGYFPLVKSHSMTLDIDNEDNNTYTFWYVQKDAVPYSVYYVTENQNEAGTLTSITLDDKTYYIVADTNTYDDNRKAVVTETFVPVSGYVPDAYQKRLVVDGADGADNKIVFIYTKDSVHAYYKITHYTQNLDGETWTEYASSQVVGDIGTTYTADPMTIDGFTYDSTVSGTVVSGELTANGLELKLYYIRNVYPYVVRYLEQNTGVPLAEPKTGSDKYGQVISENAIDITNYTAVAPTSQTWTIHIEESATEAKLNIITFYYVEKEAVINYTVIGPAGCGTVTPLIETVKIKTTETAKGSTAKAFTGYRFVGWYDNQECTGTALSTDAKYVPTKPGDVWTDANYFAKFVEQEATISYEVVGPTGCGTVSSNSERVQVLSGIAQGSTATANTHYRFVGWYDNQECTGTALSTDAKYVPTKQGDIWVDATYYAKFELELGDLRLSKFVELGLNPDAAVDEEKVFTFTVTLNSVPTGSPTTYNYIIKSYGSNAVPNDTDDEVSRGTLTLSGNTLQSFSLKHKQYILIENLPVGVTYTVTEADYTADGYKAARYDSSNEVTIVEDQTTDVRCYNELDAVDGNLQISKTVNDLSGNSSAPVQAFRFTVILTKIEETPTGPFTVTYTNSKGALSENTYTLGGQNFTLAATVTPVEGADDEYSFTLDLCDGLTATIKDIPYCGYTVTEADYSAQNFSTTLTGNTGIIGGQLVQDSNDTWANPTAVVTCTNTYSVQNGDLIITKTGSQAIDENQSFIFHVNSPKNGVDMDVVIHGDGSVTIKDLLPGDYAVTEKSNWSWRYKATPNPANNVVTVPAGGTGTIEFKNERQKIQWLDGNAWCDNVFGIGFAKTNGAGAVQTTTFTMEAVLPESKENEE